MNLSNNPASIRNDERSLKKSTGKRKPGCFNRSRSALSAPYIVPAGYKEDGSKRYMGIRTAWNNAASGACNYASTDEGKADSDCDGCVWRIES